ncbi:MAG: ribosomal L7Ae/L30e/S12e/Gadd45 family protein [Clostridia bacterium]|nr:ribosomal L7Ae/L30e/S12e/Gadd45 family protein [Clostridia bacterium]
MKQNTLGVIGLAARARGISIGSNQVLEAIRGKKAKLVLIASDASDNTKKNISDKATYYNAKFLVADATAEELGRAVGHSHTAAIAFTDINFVKAYEKSLS